MVEKKCCENTPLERVNGALHLSGGSQTLVCICICTGVGGSAGCNATLLVRPWPLWLCHTGLAPALFAKDQCQVYIFNMGMWWLQTEKHGSYHEQPTVSVHCALLIAVLPTSFKMLCVFLQSEKKEKVGRGFAQLSPRDDTSHQSGRHQRSQPFHLQEYQNEGNG